MKEDDREEYAKRIIETFVPKGKGYEYLTRRTSTEGLKRSDLPSPTPLKFSKQDRFDG